MVSNSGYIKVLPGTIKCVSILLLATTLAIAAYATLNSEYVKNRESVKPVFNEEEVSIWREICLISSAAVCLVASIINIMIHVISKAIYWNTKTGIYDFIYHACCFILLFSSGGLNVVSAVKIFEINCTSENKCQEFELKIAAGGLAIVSAFVCAVIAVVVLTNRKDVERDGLLTDEK